MSKQMRFLNVLLSVVFLALIFCGPVFCGSTSVTEWPFWKNFKHASKPSQSFSTPTGNVLQSLEIMIRLGSSYGVEESSDGFIGKTAIGLGGVAEVELTRSSFMNKLTGQQNSYPTSVFKVALVPTRFSRRWYIPYISLQLHSTPWRPSVDSNSHLKADVRAVFNSQNLSRMNIESRFTTLYFIAGKDFHWVRLHGGGTITDVRIRNGYQWIFDRKVGYDTYYPIPDFQKNLIAPFGNISITLNPETCLLAEIQSIPMIDYTIETHDLIIKRTWKTIVGVRFFIGNWLSLDTGVKYLSSSRGIADSEVNVGLNILVPLKRNSNDRK